MVTVPFMFFYSLQVHHFHIISTKKQKIIDKDATCCYNKNVTYCYIMQKGELFMATVYCLRCIWIYERGGVTYCGNPRCDLYNKSVTADWGKCCVYYKEK